MQSIISTGDTSSSAQVAERKNKAIILIIGRVQTIQQVTAGPPPEVGDFH